MKINFFFFIKAKTCLAFATAALIGIGLIACNKDKNKPGPEPKQEDIIMTTKKNPGEEISLQFYKNDAPVVEGATMKQEVKIDDKWKKQTYKLTAKNINIIGKVTRLKCSDCGLTSLDVSKNTQLIELYCEKNNLQYLDVSKNTKLSTLSCLNNNISADNLLLPDLTGKKQGALYFKDINEGDDQCLTSEYVKSILDKNWEVFQLIDYEWADYEGNNFYILMTTEKNPGEDITLEFDKNDTPVVEGATMKGEETRLGDWKKQTYTLTDKSIKVKSKVTTFNCENCKLNNLNIQNNTLLTYLNCSNNNLTFLEVGKNTKLKFLACSKNQLSSLDVINNMQLSYLYCYGNNLNITSLKLPKLTGPDKGLLYFRHTQDDTQVLSKRQVKKINDLNWDVYLISKSDGIHTERIYAGEEKDTEIILKTTKDVNTQLQLAFRTGDSPVVEGAEYIRTSGISDWWEERFYRLKEKTIIISGRVTGLGCSNAKLTHLEIAPDAEVNIVSCEHNSLSGDNLKLPNRNGKSEGELRFKSFSSGDTQKLSKKEVEEIKKMNWKVSALAKNASGDNYEFEYEGE